VLGETAAEHHAATVSFGRFEANQSVQQANYEDISSVDADLIWKMIKVCSFNSAATENVLLQNFHN